MIIMKSKISFNDNQHICISGQSRRQAFYFIILGWISYHKIVTIMYYGKNKLHDIHHTNPGMTVKTNIFII
jgi:hypothetical protein